MWVYKSFLALLAVLLTLGTVFVWEASSSEALHLTGDPSYFLKQHLIRLVIGVVVFLVATKVPLNWWKKISMWAYLASLVLLLGVFIPGVGLKLNGASRWLTLGGVVIQPVELAKLGIVLFFSEWLSRHQKLAPFLALTFIPACLTLLQPDLGSLLIIVTIAFGLFFVAGGKLTSILGIGAVGIAILALAILLSPYRRQRLTTYLNPELDPQGAGFHIRQITLALSNGGWTGVGLGNSRQKFAYLPEASTDSIFAIVAEELGFLGSLFIIIIFASWLAMLAMLVWSARVDTFAFLLGSGIWIWVVNQVLLNLAAVVALVPLTGIPLPFFSYGGSSLIMILLISGIAAKIGRVHQGYYD